MNPGITPFDAAAILIVLAAVLGYLNYRFVRLPSSIGLTVMGALASLLVVGIDRLAPALGIGATVVRFVDGIDFHRTLMDGMLSFLLFAGALQIRWDDLHRGRWPVLVLSTVGTILSTVLVGAGFFALAGLLGRPVPLAWAMVFGALVSPTDPVAVIGALGRIRIGATLKATVAGESLFNDGVGVVIVSILLASALGGTGFALPHALLLFVQVAGGGAALGFAIGWIAYRAMRTIDEYQVEAMIAIATVMGGYALASAIGVSGPVAMAVAGLIVGNKGVADAMSDTTRDHLLQFWALVDDVLNAVLFLLIGLEVVAIPFDPPAIALGLAAIPLLLAARAVSVLMPLRMIRALRSLGPVAATTLIWGGLRGGISVALALGLPAGPIRAIALTATYVVVLFSVIVQGGTIARVLAGIDRRAATADP